MKAIQTINLTKRYGKHRGIENVGLAIDEGDFFGFIGPNGAGKSTTIRTLLGLIFPTSGTAEIFGFLQAAQRKSSESKSLTTRRRSLLRWATCRRKLSTTAI